jgi:hypothetical protein
MPFNYEITAEMSYLGTVNQICQQGKRIPPNTDEGDCCGL